MSPSIEDVLMLAVRGFTLVPLHSPAGARCDCGQPHCPSVGKHPRLSRWGRQATTDSKTLARWWERWPTANVGAVTGAAAARIVIDIDPRHGGDETLYELERRRGRLPRTVETLTGGGGRHLWFSLPRGQIVRGGVQLLGPGVDVQAEGQLVVVPPSVHVSGR